MGGLEVVLGTGDINMIGRRFRSFTLEKWKKGREPIIEYHES